MQRQETEAHPRTHTHCTRTQHQHHLHTLASPPILIPGLLLCLSSEAGLLPTSSHYIHHNNDTTPPVPHPRHHTISKPQTSSQPYAVPKHKHTNTYTKSQAFSTGPSRSLYFIRPPVYLQMYDPARAPASAPAPIPAPAPTPTPGCPAAAAPAFCRRLRRCCCSRVLGMNE